MSGRKTLKEALGESESEVSFESVSTNPDQTPYSLNLSSKLKKPQRSSPRKPGKENSNIGNQLNRNQQSNPQPSTSGKAGNMRPVTKPPVAGGRNRAAAGASKLNASKAKNNSRRQQIESSEEESEASGPPAPAPVARKPRKSLKVTRKLRQDMAIMKDVIRLQKSTQNLIPMAAFTRLVREILQKFTRKGGDLRVTKECLDVLREVSEVYTTGVLSDSYLVTKSRKQVTLQPRDIQLICFLRGPH